MPTSFLVPECHLKGVKSSTGEKKFFSPLPSEGKPDEVKECTIAERTVKVCLLHLRLEYLRKCVTGRIYFQVGVIWLNAFTGFNDGGS